MSGVNRQVLTWVALGSLTGGLTRYLISIPWLMGWGGLFPWPTLAANVIGCGLIGFWYALMMFRQGWWSTPGVQAGVMAGYCGGLTTFSIFSLETLVLIEAGEWLTWFVYLVASLLSWCFAVYCGFSIGRIVFDPADSQTGMDDPD